MQWSEVSLEELSVEWVSVAREEQEQLKTQSLYNMYHLQPVIMDNLAWKRHIAPPPAHLLQHIYWNHRCSLPPDQECKHGLSEGHGCTHAVYQDH